MGLTLEVILFALLVLVLNVMDSVTTELCFRQYPDKSLKGEGNPVMRWLMLKSRTLAEICKQGFVFGIVAYFVYNYELVSLRYALIMFSLVVLNNSYVFLSRALLKRKVETPFHRLIAFLHIPDRFGYLSIIFIIVLLTRSIYYLIWG